MLRVAATPAPEGPGMEVIVRSRTDRETHLFTLRLDAPYML